MIGRSRAKHLATMVFLLGHVCITSCLHSPTIEKEEYKPFLHGQPIAQENLQTIREKSPKDAVFADLLQAFALMRTKDLNQSRVRKEIVGLLETSVSSFEDMTDPVNFSAAFSLDEDKAYRGRPHERMFASTMAAVFLMSENRFGEALPYLRNAEFLDARFQKMPFGTDAPLVYALMYRCLLQQKAQAVDIEHAERGVRRSIRFLTLQEPLIKAMVLVSEADVRKAAFGRRLAYMIFEVSLYHSLMTAPDASDVSSLLDDAAKQSQIFIAALNTYFNDEYKARMKPLVVELAKVYGLNKKAGIAHLEEMAFSQVSVEAHDIAAKIKQVIAKKPQVKKSIDDGVSRVDSLSKEILKAASANKMTLTFLGNGPAVVRQGSYDEITVIRPSADAHLEPSVRQRIMKVSEGCGFFRKESGGFSVTMCTATASKSDGAVMLPNLELLSLSRKATTAQGRQFDKILKGRAQFREATETIAEVGAWSAFFLFYLGAELIADCQRHHQSEACYTKGFVVWGVAGVTALFSASIWLAGLSSNPAADSRYIHLMYESAWLAI